MKALICDCCQKPIDTSNYVKFKEYEASWHETYKHTRKMDFCDKCYRNFWDYLKSVSDNKHIDIKPPRPSDEHVESSPLSAWRLKREMDILKENTRASSGVKDYPKTEKPKFVPPHQRQNNPLIDSFREKSWWFKIWEIIIKEEKFLFLKNY